jgi:hypothetical protein
MRAVDDGRFRKWRSPVGLVLPVEGRCKTENVGTSWILTPSTIAH